MQKYNSIVTDVNGNVVPTASITVNVHGGGAATVYSDNSGTVRTQPFTPNSLGEFFFYAADGRYDVTATFGGTAYTDSDVILFDPAASTGALGVGYTPAGTGAVATTVQSKLRESVSVKDFGATGNGTTDDTAAIQAAVTAGYASGNGVNLYFPAGTYLMSSTITMGNTAPTCGIPVHFRGDFRNSIIKVTAANVNPFLFQGPNPDVDGAGNRTGNIKIENLKFQGPGLPNANTNSIAIKFYGVQGITLINTYCTGWYCGEYYQNVDLVNRYNVWIQGNTNGILTEATGYALNSSLNSFNSYGGQVGNNTSIGISYLGGIAPLFSGVNFTVNGTSLVMSPNHAGGAMVTVAPVVSCCYFEGDTSTSIILGGGNGIVRTPIIEGGYMIAASANPLITVANASNDAGYGRINIGYDIGFAGSSFITQASSATKIPVQYTTGMSGTAAVGAFGVGGRVPSTSGAGISFPSTQQGSTDANTIDDYAEGTWTPTLLFGGSNTGMTFSAQSGTYTKIGNMVFINCYLQITNVGSSTGNATISGLPYAGNGTQKGFLIAVDQLTVTGQVIAFEPGGTTYLQLYPINNGVLGAALTQAAMTNNSVFRFNFHYSV